MNEPLETLRGASLEIIDVWAVAAIAVLSEIGARRHTAMRSRRARSSAGSSSFAKSPAFRQLLYFARRGQCRLFIGSGVSSEAGMPGVQALVGALRAELNEIGIPVPGDVTLPMIAAMMERDLGRPDLIEVLRSTFEENLQKTPPPWKRGAYPWIPRLASALAKEIYTSNWDDLLKRAFEQTGQKAREIRHPDELSLIPQAEHAIVKVHRDFHSPKGPIVSEADYAVALDDIDRGTGGTLWGHLADQLTQYRFVFVGYSLGDPTVRLIQRVVELRTDAMGERRHFLVGPMSPEEAQAAKRWAGMRPIVAGAAEFFRALVQAPSRSP